MITYSEGLIVEALKQGDERAYRFLFDRHYAVLCHIAVQYVHDDFLAETIVGDVIFHLWEARERLSINTSVRNYLVRCVRNRCLDELKSQYRRHEVQMSGISPREMPGIGSLQDGSYPLGRLLENELEEEIAKAISRLPEECRKVFRMSRFSGLKYDEIARQSGISVNTVKYHIKHALELLAKDLHRYLISLVLMLLPGC